MPYIAPEVITEAKRMDLLTYLREYEPGELVKFSSNTYTTRTHDSLKISNGKWMWWSRGIGGKSALDYLIKVRGMDFVQAVQTIMGNGSVSFPTCKNIKSYEEQPLLLPQKSPTTEVVFDYLFGRGIDYEIINHCLEQELIIESLPYHNAVFIGYDENKEPKYAAYRATNQSRIMGDCTGSKKQYSFRLTAENTGEVHLFECAIDLLSYATLMKLEGKDWRQFNLVSLAGVYSPKQKIEDSKVPVTLGRLLEKDKTIRRIVLHLDNDIAGRKATKALQTILSDKYEVVDDPPQYGKDVNDFLCKRLGIREISGQCVFHCGVVFEKFGGVLEMQQIPKFKAGIGECNMDPLRICHFPCLGEQTVLCSDGVRVVVVHIAICNYPYRVSL